MIIPLSSIALALHALIILLEPLGKILKLQNEFTKHSRLYKIRVKNTAKDKNGISLEADYTSERGFTTISLRDESFGTSIQCDARPLKASPVVESLNIFANNSKDFTGLELNWSPLIGATRYGLKIDLISENKYFKETYIE